MALEFQQFAGSPDVFRTDTGKIISEQEAQVAGLFTPQGLDPSRVTVSKTPRPAITQESQFAQFGGTDLSPQEMQSLGFVVTGAVADPSPPIEIDTSPLGGEFRVADSRGFTSVQDLQDAIDADVTEEDNTALLGEEIKRRRRIEQEILTFGLQSQEEKDLETRILASQQESREAQFEILDRPGGALRGAILREAENVERGLTSESRTRLLKELVIAEKLSLLQGQRLGDLEIKRLQLGISESIFDDLIQKANIEAKNRNLTDNIFRSDFQTDPATGDVSWVGITKQGEPFNIPTDIKGEVDDPLLSVTDATRLGVPFGTKRSEAANLGIIPTTTTTPQPTGLDTLSVTQRAALALAVQAVSTAGSRDVALQGLEQDQGFILASFGQVGLNAVRAEIDRVFPAPTPAGPALGPPIPEGFIPSPGPTPVPGPTPTPPSPGVPAPIIDEAGGAFGAVKGFFERIFGD